VRILALYDIHANIAALDAVLADPRAADPDVVVVGGDAVPGPFAGATLARLEALSVTGVRFVNAGSVGLPYEGDGAARWLWVADARSSSRSSRSS
jgi:hypothetical protein